MQIRSPASIGALIRARRRELKLGQEALANRVGVTRQWIIAVEKGKSTAEIGLVLRTLAALGLMLEAHPEKKPTRITYTPAAGALPIIDVDGIVSDSKKRS